MKKTMEFLVMNSSKTRTVVFLLLLLVFLVPRFFFSKCLLLPVNVSWAMVYFSTIAALFLYFNIYAYTEIIKPLINDCKLESGLDNSDRFDARNFWAYFIGFYATFFLLWLRNSEYTQSWLQVVKYTAGVFCYGFVCFVILVIVFAFIEELQRIFSMNEINDALIHDSEKKENIENADDSI